MQIGTYSHSYVQYIDGKEWYEYYDENAEYTISLENAGEASGVNISDWYVCACVCTTYTYILWGTAALANNVDSPIWRRTDLRPWEGERTALGTIPNADIYDVWKLREKFGSLRLAKWLSHNWEMITRGLKLLYTQAPLYSRLGAFELKLFWHILDMEGFVAWSLISESFYRNEWLNILCQLCSTIISFFFWFCVFLMVIFSLVLILILLPFLFTLYSYYMNLYFLLFLWYCLRVLSEANKLWINLFRSLILCVSVSVSRFAWPT